MSVAYNGQTSISTLEQSHCLLDDISDAVDGFNSFDSQSLGICKNARLSTSADSYGRDRKSSGDEDEWHVAQMFNKWVRFDKRGGETNIHKLYFILGHRIGRRTLLYCPETKSPCRWKPQRITPAISMQIYSVSSV